MTKKEEIEVWVALDGEGNSYASTSEEALTCEMTEFATNEVRLARLRVRMSRPEVPVLEIDVPDEDTAIEEVEVGKA